MASSILEPRACARRAVVATARGVALASAFLIAAAPSAQAHRRSAVREHRAPEREPLALAATSAHDDERDPDALIQRGVELRRARDDAAALTLFQRAYQLRNTPRALAQIGLAEQALGMWLAADRHIRQALETSGDRWIQKNRATLDHALGEIAKHMGHVEVRGTPAGAEVRIDGDLVGTLPLTSAVGAAVGEIAIEVRAPGYLPIVRRAQVVGGGLARESVALRPAPSERVESRAPSSAAASPATSLATPLRPSGEAGPGEAPAARAPRREGEGDGAAADHRGRDGQHEGGRGPDDAAGGARGARRVGAFALGAAAVGGLAFGVFEHLAWQRDVDSFTAKAYCDGALTDRGGGDCQSLFDDGHRARTLAIVGYAASAAFAGMAAFLYLTSDADSSGPGNLACAPSVLTPGAACALRF